MSLHASTNYNILQAQHSTVRPLIIRNILLFSLLAGHNNSQNLQLVLLSIGYGKKNKNALHKSRLSLKRSLSLYSKKKIALEISRYPLVLRQK